MPIYEYECNECGQHFDLRRRFEDDDADVTCPECGAEHPKRVITTFDIWAASGGCAPIGGG